MNEKQKDYAGDALDEKTLNPNPVSQFKSWFADAAATGMHLPEAMTLATSTREGKPAARMLLLKQADDRGFVFYTNYRSSKARELDQNPFAALVFYWPQLERQVRVEGSVSRVSARESDEYFRTRPRESQIGALASPQSEVIENREALERRFRELDESYRDREVDRPEHWGGYRLKPARIEFWKGRRGRLHDRIVYDLQPDGSWSIKRLAP
ncbi:MAG TPA: pyridoxamine 5'-phosphate oxidase [Pyrinomonadaceae bacterium]|nr:pyridoxamine 5'-phosphate oxidase [Pyrinomonadaceae bacterium]